MEALLAIRQLLQDGVREEILRSPLGGNIKALERYLLETLGGLRCERMIAIMADEAGFVISEEVVANGGEGHVQVSSRFLFGRALSLDARRMLIAHNHPSGTPEPSTTDIAQTRELASQAERLGISLVDHLVVGRRHIVSMRERGVF